MVMGILLIAFMVRNSLTWNASGIVEALRLSAPNGQLLYVLSKAFGLIAIGLLWWQLFSSLLCALSSKFIFFKAGRTTHIILGFILLSLIVLHAGFFITAVSSRQGYSAAYLLLPNFSDYYHSALSLGVIALFLTLLSISIVLLKRHLTRFWLLGHYLVVIVFALVSTHALLIGSEANADLFRYLIWFFMGSISLLMIVLMWRKLRFREPT